MAVLDVLEKYKGSTFKAEFSDGEVCFLNAETVADFHLKPGMNVPDEAREEIKAADELRKARERALYLLDYRDYSFVELYKKLEQNYSEETCLKVLERLVELGLVNDERYAKRLAEKYVVTKKLGFYRARQEMLLKGLDKELVEEVLEPYEEDTSERLSELVEKKYARRITDRNSLQKVKNALVRQGYSYSDINAVLDEYDDFDE